jgi:hypothetical protein
VVNALAKAGVDMGENGSVFLHRELHDHDQANAGRRIEDEQPLSRD